MKHARTRPRVFGWKLLFIALAALLSALTHSTFERQKPTVAAEPIEPYPMFEQKAGQRKAPPEATLSDAADSNSRKRERL
ncbi:MAG TPA: hypothetical protein EYO33_29300 [Phycisphaerales bacterium]|nr:hypothetical protein [Phycisphaerales bacterium]